MKRLATILLCFSVLCAVKADELTGWEKHLSHKEGERELEKIPVVSLKTIKKNTVFVEIKNETGSDLKYNGYSKASPQLFFKRKKGDIWTPAAWHWCGTGISSFTLKDKEIVVFELYHDEKEAVQVFTVFTDAKDNKVFSIVKLYQ